MTATRLPDVWVRAHPYGNRQTRDLHDQWFSERTNFFDDAFKGKAHVLLATNFHNWDDKGNAIDDPTTIGEVVATAYANPQTGVKDGRWDRVRFNDNLSDALKADFAKAMADGTLFASPTVVPDLHKVNKATGEIMAWCPASISIVHAKDGKRPASFNAIGVPALKAVYAKAGLELPTKKEDVTMKVPDFIKAFRDLTKAAPSKAEMTDEDKDLWDEVFENDDKEPAGDSKEKSDPTAPITLTEEPMTDAEKKEFDGLKLQYAEQANQLKAYAEQAETLQARLDQKEVEVWVDDQIKAGRIVPAQRNEIFEIAYQAKLDDERPSTMKAANGEMVSRLAAFKKTVEAYPAKPLTSDQLKAGGFDSKPTDKDVSDARLKELLNTTPEGKKALAEMK